MATDNNASRAEWLRLRADLARYETLYREGKPEVSDSVFDEMFLRYQTLADELGEAEDARLDARPGADHTDGFVEVVHRVPMLSLEKLTPNRRDAKGVAVPLAEQLENWFAKRRASLELPEGAPLAVLVEPKIDGISVSLHYENGKLVQAVTRGDGKKGDDITRNVLEAGAVPRVLKNMPSKLEIRGELYWPRANFLRYNEVLKREGGETIANPRNGCAGMMKRKESAGLAEVGIRTFLYQVADVTGERGEVPATQSGILAWLARAGADVYESEVRVLSTPSEVLEYCEQYGTRRGELDFDIDGMVIKVDSLALYDRLGSTGHHPHWGIAYKFPPERGATRVVSIDVSVGKSGKLTPVANLEPLPLAGTTVSRASLHNFGELEKKDVRVDDIVYVEKAGDIIPYVVGVKTRGAGAPFPRPSNCPACDAVVLQEEVFLYCSNLGCMAQRQERLTHFASRRAMDIDGMGEQLIVQLVSRLDLATPDALFRLRKEDFLKLERMGEKSANNLVRALETAKNARVRTRALRTCDSSYW